MKLQKSHEFHHRIVQKQFRVKKNTRCDREMPKERYLSPEKRQSIIDDLKLL